MAAAYATDTKVAQDEVQSARDLLPKVCLPDEVAQQGLQLVSELQLDSLRACVTLFEAGRAYAALEGRETVDLDDLAAVAPMALRLRRSPFMAEFFSGQAKEEQELNDALARVLPKQGGLL
jgi:magnesium chelatase subunit I